MLLSKNTHKTHKIVKVAVINNFAPSLFRSLCEFIGDCFGPRYFSSGAALPQKNTSIQNNHLRFHTMTSKKMVRSYYCLIMLQKFGNDKLKLIHNSCLINILVQYISMISLLFSLPWSNISINQKDKYCSTSLVLVHMKQVTSTYGFEIIVLYVTISFVGVILCRP